MSAVAVLCPRCHANINDITLNAGEFSRCPRCSSTFQLEVFPAFFKRLSSVPEAELVLVEGESTCFYHADKKALLPCQGCGRFLCALCDCELHGEHFCPACLEAGARKGKIKSLENKRTKYDSIALALAIAPMLIFYFTLITAPLTLYVCIRYWKAPGSILHRTKIRFVIAMVIATLQLVGWAILIIFAVTLFNGNLNV